MKSLLDSNQAYSNEMSSILENYGIVEYAKQHDIIYNYQNPANAVFYLTKGCIRIVNQYKGKSKVIHAGDFFGDRSIFYSEYIYTEAITPVQYIRVEDESFRRLIDRHAKLAFDIINNITRSSIDVRKDHTILARMKYFIKTSAIPYIGNSKKRRHGYCS